MIQQKLPGVKRLIGNFRESILVSIVLAFPQHVSIRWKEAPNQPDVAGIIIVRYGY
jgi:hypothetical protein